MQYLLIDKNDTLMNLSKIVGTQNVELLLAENGLKRTPKIGKAWQERCESIIENTPNEVSASRKATLLNGLTGSEEVFEKACLMDEDEWKVFSSLQAFPDALRVPQSIKLPYSTKVIGDTLGDVEAVLGVASVSRATNASSSSSTNAASSSSTYSTSMRSQSDAKAARSKITSKTSSSQPVSSVTYQAVMNTLKKSSVIDQSVLDSVNTSPPVKIDNSSEISQKSSQYAFNIPWGKVQIYSSLIKDVMDFPAYPEELETTRTASYTSMPDVIYQYEPWIMYQSSGPREQSLDFHLHRDMWTGNHLDGNANKLIRFCEANTFPAYQGSAVISPTVRIYIDGSLFISGVLTSTNVRWSGPLGLDNWYLEFNLSLSIQEVSDTPLDIKTVSGLGLKGWDPKGIGVV